jgi:hypothetical protein
MTQWDAEIQEFGSFIAKLMKAKYPEIDERNLEDKCQAISEILHGAIRQSYLIESTGHIGRWYIDYRVRAV